ncbi:hypothetical protein [Streptomyces sp. NPDC053367]|uniref:hypothetical protein n=1 Tax=Streptomyces sp. NPDC053367 TaxID=3365700 RepID=UPI0037D05AED
MNTPGTIDRPLTHDPKKQAPMKPSTSEPTGSVIEDVTTTGATDSRQNRTREMQLIPEALARAHMHDRLRDAQAERRALSVATARRMQRRAERASLRARRALALAVMQ